MASENHTSVRYAGWKLFAIISLLVCLFAAYGGCPPPDVNESHYLVKAKHYWDRKWCERDLFLQSSNPHAVFYLAIGWMTQWFSLPATAYLGRLIAWTMLACSWHRLLAALTSRPMLSALAAAWFLILSDSCRMAGEWVVGGVEAKPFAYSCVFAGLAAMVAGNFRTCWLWYGAAMAFHFVVGGWAIVAAILTVLLSNEQNLSLRKIVPWLAAGLVPALLSVWAAGDVFNSGITYAEARQADRIIVYDRLAHHLAFHTFPHRRMIKFAVLVAATVVMGKRLSHGDLRSTRLVRFALATVLIAGAGIVIDQSLLWNLDLAAMILRYYWYRLADAIIPAVGAIWVAVAYERIKMHRSLWADRYLVVALLVPTVILTVTLTVAQQDVRPMADRRFDGTVDNKERAWRKYHNWIRVCEYIRSHTAPDAVFWTPFDQQTFKWHAHRAEIVNWKDVPQDARHILEWHRRLQDLYPRGLAGRHATGWSDEEIIEKMRRYGAHYLLVERGRMLRPLGVALRQVYPNVRYENEDFAIYQVVP